MGDDSCEFFEHAAALLQVRFTVRDPLGAYIFDPASPGQSADDGPPVTSGTGATEETAVMDGVTAELGDARPEGPGRPRAQTS